MIVTLAHIRREYATQRTLWVQVIAQAASVLCAEEIARWLLGRGQPLVPALLPAGLVLAGGWYLAQPLARAARRAGLDSELWRKFGLARPLLDACAALPALSPADEQLLDQALSDVRGLAAVRNHAAWDEPDAPDPGDVVERAERALQHALAAGLDAPLQPVAERLRRLNQEQLAALSALLKGDGDELARAWQAFTEAAAELPAAVVESS